MSQLLPPSPKPQVASPGRVAQVLRGQRSARHADDDELPPSARSRRRWFGRRPGPPSGSERRDQPRPRRFRRLLMALAVAALGMGLWSWDQGESAHRNWQHHQHATHQWESTRNASVEDQQPMKWVLGLGPAEFTSRIPVSLDDHDEPTSEAVHTALTRGDRDEAERILRDAQQDLADAETAYQHLETRPDEAVAVPSISSGMHRALLTGDAHFFHIYLYDSCDEDGDIVDLEINGLRFATVPITHQGTTLSVPLSVTSATKIVIRGIWDGGGGITVACRTSQGQGFIRVLQPGEEQVLAVVVGR